MKQTFAWVLIGGLISSTIYLIKNRNTGDV